MPEDRKSKTFTWESPDGVKITVPAMGRIKAGVIRRNRNAEGVDGMFNIIEAVVDEKTLAKVDDLESSDLNAFVEAWQEDAQTNVGESSGSST
jgi:hypothetical protein